jgi:phosphoglycerate dehydrogenase-like enzyme
MSPFTEPLRIAILDDYQQIALDMADWRRLGAARIDAFPDHETEENALVSRLEPFNIIVAMRERTPFPRSLIERLPNLRLLVTTGPANAVIDVRAANERGIPVVGTGYSPSDTAELAWGLIIAMARSLPEEIEAVRSERWQERLGTVLAGKTLGILGLGNLGRRVARFGAAFDMDVIAWSQNLTADAAAAAGARLVDRAELFTTSDVLSIHLILSDRTRGLVGTAELNSMKPTAYLVNTSRAQIIDEQALVTALRARRIARAAVDVFAEEPLPIDHPFREIPELLLTPHIGYVTEENYRIFFGDIVEDIEAFTRGSLVREVFPR